MSYDRYQITYHLTRNGWTSEDGDCLPEERVETWEKDVCQGSGFGPESESWAKLWFNPNFSESERSALREKFPFPKRPQISEEWLRGLRL